MPNNDVLLSNGERLNSYRFLSGREPSDEMLSLIMKEVAQEAAESNRRAAEVYFEQMNRNIAAKQAKWAVRIKEAIDGQG